MSIAPSTYKAFCMILLSALIFFLSAFACMAATPGSKAPVTGGKKTLMLFAKNPATWAIVKKGASGKMIYNESSGAFTLNASGLYPRSAYALIRYADDPPRVEILARGMSDERSRLDLGGVWHHWTRKFWLVSGEDVVGRAGYAGSLRAWRPHRYLFEEKPVGIDCICPEPEEP
jgi:hypothetical protein